MFDLTFFLYQYIWCFWLGLFVLFIVIEVLSFNLVSIWFSLGSLAAMAISFTHVNIWFQLLLFLFVSLILILIARPLATLYFIKDTIKTNADSLIGEVARVTKRVSSDGGEVKVHGQIWSAISLNDESFEEGNPVIVKEIRGVKLYVLSSENIIDSKEKPEEV